MITPSGSSVASSERFGGITSDKKCYANQCRASDQMTMIWLRNYARTVWSNQSDEGNASTEDDSHTGKRGDPDNDPSPQ
ncbi:MAG: hypothetical protein R3A47_05090 [Polyangiales bacterium]